MLPWLGHALSRDPGRSDPVADIGESSTLRDASRVGPKLAGGGDALGFCQVARRSFREMYAVAATRRRNAAGTGNAGPRRRGLLIGKRRQESRSNGKDGGQEVSQRSRKCLEMPKGETAARKHLL